MTNCNGNSRHLARLTRATLAGVLFVVCGGCDEDVASRITLRLADDAQTWPMDLNPNTAAQGIDNNIVVTADFESVFEDSTRTLEWVQYQVQYGVGEEFSPFIAGELEVDHIEGTTIDITVLGAATDQLTWVFERYSGGELVVPFRVGLAGVFQDSVGVTVFQEFTAAFADYQPTYTQTAP